MCFSDLEEVLKCRYPHVNDNPMGTDRGISDLKKTTRNTYRKNYTFFCQHADIVLT